jgi:hypothetical protein
MEQVADPITESVDELLRTLETITSKVDYGVGFETSSLFSECACPLLCDAVETQIVN